MPLSDVPAKVLSESRGRWYQTLGHVPKLGQRLMDDAVDAGKRFVGLFTPPQDGKSYSIAKHVGSYLLFPDVHIWFIGPTYQDASKEYGYLFQDLGAMGLLKQAKRKHFDIRGGNMHVELKNGSWAQVISAENPENLRREQLDVVVLCEASKLNENLYDRYVYSRVERRRGRVFCPTTFKGYGWVWDKFRVPSLPVRPGTWQWGPWIDNRRAKIGGDVNPLYDDEHFSVQVSYVPEFGEVMHRGEFTDEVIAKARLRLPRPMFAEQFGGEAASYAGLVYPFDPTIHEVDPFDIPREWTHVVGWDHGAGGGSDPTAILMGSYAPDGTLYWWGEIYDTEPRSISQRGGFLKLKLSGKQASAIMTGRDAKQVISELMTVGLVAACPHDWSVGARIIRMTELMQTKKWKILRGRCPNLKREILAYEWDEKDPGKPKDGNDHALEAAGYASLAPVGLPDAATAPAPALTPAQRAEQAKVDFVWGDYLKARKEQEDREAGRGLDRILEPDPLEMVEEWVA